MNKPTRFRAIRLGAILLVLVCTVGCDQATKHFARTELSQMAPQALPGGFVELTLAENPGAFLSLGTSTGNAMLVASQVLKANLGTRFIQITSNDGWDMHTHIYTGPRNIQAKATIIDD